jgi:uncharacterized membrane protein
MSSSEIHPEDRERRARNTTRIASLVIMTAVTAVFTFMIRIPIAPTRGYLNLGDVAIFFSALIFGPWTALISGGLGTALADIISGYSQWAPLTFFAHGLQGLAAGFLFHRIAGADARLGQGRTFTGLLLAFLAGTVIMAGLYFAAGAFMFGPGAALVEVPGNILQNLAGIVAGTLLWSAVKRAYPPVTRYRW